MALHCNAISHWLGAYTEWSLLQSNAGLQPRVWGYYVQSKFHHQHFFHPVSPYIIMVIILFIIMWCFETQLFCSIPVSACLLQLLDTELSAEDSIQKVRDLRGPGAIQSIKVGSQITLTSNSEAAKLNSLWPCDVIWRKGSRSTMAQVMACCLTAPSHYLNQCWLISKV